MNDLNNKLTKYSNVLIESLEKTLIHLHKKNRKGRVQLLYEVRVEKYMISYKRINPEEIEITKILHETTD